MTSGDTLCLLMFFCLTDLFSFAFMAIHVFCFSNGSYLCSVPGNLTLKCIEIEYQVI